MNTNGRIVEFMNAGKRMRALVSAGGNAMQGVIYVDHPKRIASNFLRYAARFINEELKGDPASRLLILGGGTYTLPRHILKGTKIDVVEIIEGMHEIAAQYFGYKGGDNITHVYQDARDFVAKTEARYDIIVVDIFDEKEVPAYFRSTNFYKKLYKLAPVVLVNEMSVGDKRPRYNFQPFTKIEERKLRAPKGYWWQLVTLRR